MRSHGVPDFPILKQGPGGSLVDPASPHAGMLTTPVITRRSGPA